MRDLTYVDYDRDGNVAIFEIADWERLFETEMDEAETRYGEIASDPDITATVVYFDSADTLTGEMQDHITDAWSQLAQAVDIEKSAYVADGITAMAVKSNVTAPDVAIDSFNSLDAAISWAKA